MCVRCMPPPKRVRASTGLNRMRLPAFGNASLMPRQRAAGLGRTRQLPLRGTPSLGWQLRVVRLRSRLGSLRANAVGGNPPLRSCSWQVGDWRSRSRIDPQGYRALPRKPQPELPRVASRPSGWGDLGDQLFDVSPDLVADRPHRIDTLAGWIFQHPVFIPLAGEHRADVAATHGDHYI